VLGDAETYTPMCETTGAREKAMRPRMTQQLRRRLLVILFVVVIGAFQSANWWANRRADDRAEDTAEQLRAILPAMDLVELRTDPDRIIQMLPVRSVIQEGKGVRVNVEVSSLWQLRCVVGHIGPDAVASINTFRKGCGG